MAKNATEALNAVKWKGHLEKITIRGQQSADRLFAALDGYNSDETPAGWLGALQFEKDDMDFETNLDNHTFVITCRVKEHNTVRAHLEKIVRENQGQLG
jgi:hypothetical protein